MVSVCTLSDELFQTLLISIYKTSHTVIICFIWKYLEAAIYPSSTSKSLQYDRQKKKGQASTARAILLYISPDLKEKNSIAVLVPLL